MSAKTRKQISQTIGSRLRDARNKLEWSTQKLAQEANVSVGAINAVENKQSMPNVKTLLRLGQALGLNMNQLTGA